MENSERLDWISTSRLASMALNLAAHSGNANGFRYTWEAISGDQAGAQEFYATIDDDEELRSLALDALDMAGWTSAAINFRLS